jgi:hypothetical protein
MGCAGRRNEKGRTRNENDRTENGDRTWEWAVRGGENRKGRTKNENDITENVAEHECQATFTALISSRDKLEYQ